MATAISAPVTPKKPKGEDLITDIIKKFNEDYCLGADVPDPSETPSDRKERAAKDKRFARCNQIWQGVRFLYYRKDGSLEQVSRGFFFEAKSLGRAWPALPGQSAPMSGDFPVAATSAQQVQLQELLIDLLARAKRSLAEVPRPEPLQQSKEYASNLDDLFAEEEAILAELPPPTRSKRPSLEAQEKSPKRSRGLGQSARQMGPAKQVTSALDTVMSRQKSLLGQEQLIPAHPDDSLSFTATKANSVNTSRRSFAPTVFSHTDTIATTQSTVELSSQERKEVYQHFPGSDNFSISSNELRVLHESFARHDIVAPDARPRSALARKAEKLIGTEGDQVMQDPVVPLESLEPPNVLGGRLENVWPQFPDWLHKAPLAVAWEVTRICLHCSVDPTHKTLKFDPNWAAQDIIELWKALGRLEIFQGKTFPERPTAEAWHAACGDFWSRGNAVVLSLGLEYNFGDEGPLFHVRMHPLRLEQSCRLARRFGSDRLLEVVMPSPCGGRNIPKAMKADGAPNGVIKWLTEKPHYVLGRKWMPFFVRDVGYRRPPTEFQLGRENDTAAFKDRVTFFAESGPGFRHLPSGVTYPPPNEHPNKRSEFRVGAMLKWLLQPERNLEQPHLKLFTRIQLGLSKTYPVFVFEPKQMRHRETDLLSPTGNVMNDGIGRMSRGVARKVRDELGLPDVPSAIQARLGSAKGMWLLDVEDAGDDYWIETYPSQRKWKCDFVDEHHRTLEIKTHAHELRTAALNLQFIPVLEDRASNVSQIRKVLGEMLTDDLQQEFDKHKSAMQRPIEFRLWSHNNFPQRPNRLHYGRVPFLGGLPSSKEETLNFLLDSGFSPAHQKYLQEIAWNLQKQKCDVLKTKLKIKVGRSTYAFMVMDFWGILEEGEVHVGFSSKFSDGEFSDIMLHDIDVLVARSPAHFPSDIQRVRAKFKTELRALKDVIVFSAKGDSCLAEKLSGGDYDGDKAWVCWDPRIVDGFVNADKPEMADLSRYLKKDQTTYGDLMHGFGAHATQKMIERSFQFSMQHNMLGVCTSYKERFCYTRNCVSDPQAILLSTLLSALVDQPKNGISFGNEEFDQVIREGLGRPPRPLEPAYKEDNWRRRTAPVHIIDHLKFNIAKPAIDRELEVYDKAMKRLDSPRDAAQRWDVELAKVYEDFKSINSQSCRNLLEVLIARIGEAELLWKKKMNRSREIDDYAGRIQEVYSAWCEIEPHTVDKNGSKIDSKMITLLQQRYLSDSETSHWALLKASTAFKLYYNKSNKFVWQMAGRQLAMIKAMMTRGDGVPTLVTSSMYAALMPDKRFVTQLVAKMDGTGTEYLEDLEREEEDDDADLTT